MTLWNIWRRVPCSADHLLNEGVGPILWTFRSYKLRTALRSKLHGHSKPRPFGCLPKLQFHVHRAFPRPSLLLNFTAGQTFHTTSRPLEYFEAPRRHRRTYNQHWSSKCPLFLISLSAAVQFSFDFASPPSVCFGLFLGWPQAGLGSCS